MSTAALAADARFARGLQKNNAIVSEQKNMKNMIAMRKLLGKNMAVNHTVEKPQANLGMMNSRSNVSGRGYEDSLESNMPEWLQDDNQFSL